MKRFVIFLALFIASVVVSPSRSLGASKSSPEPLAEIPIEIVNNRTVVHVPVADYFLHMVLDTGASKTALFQSDDFTFDDLEKNGRAKILFPALDETITGSRLMPIDIMFGEHTYRPQSILLIHKRPPVGDRLNFKFDGVLGQDFFAAYVVEMDSRNRLLRLYARGTDLSGANNFTKIKLHLKGGSPHIKFTNKFPWERARSEKELLLDTGYPGLIVLWNDRQFRLAAGRSNVEDYRTENKGIFARATFKISRLRFLGAPIFLGANIPKQVQERDGLIGAHVLNQFHFVIDFGSKQLLLDRSHVRFDRIDGSFYVPNNETFVYKKFAEFEASSKLKIEMKY